MKLRMSENSTVPVVTAVPAERDLRLDLFRGIALWLIFLDHIPTNIVNWVTIRNYGFSDAAEIFIFISGYTAAFVYGRSMRERGFLISSARILKRAWQIYVAHIFLFVIFLAQVSYTAARFDNPMYAEEMNLVGFLEAPHVNLLQALALRFRPANMDILPLYIVLLAVFAFVAAVVSVTLWATAAAVLPPTLATVAATLPGPLAVTSPVSAVT